MGIICDEAHTTPYVAILLTMLLWNLDPDRFRQDSDRESMRKNIIQFRNSRNEKLSSIFGRASSNQTHPIQSAFLEIIFLYDRECFIRIETKSKINSKVMR